MNAAQLLALFSGAVAVLVVWIVLSEGRRL